jgi:hypothetical protein
MPEVVDIEYENSVAGILDYGQTHRIGDTRCRQARTISCMPQIAAVAQSVVVRNELFFAGAARPAESGSERKTMRESPGDLASSFPRIKVRTAHGDFILVPAGAIV